MEVELIEEGPAPSSTSRRATRTAWSFLLAVGVALLVGFAVGHAAGTESGGRGMASTAPPRPVLPAPDDRVVETEVGVLVLMDAKILGLPETAGAETMQEAAEMWAAARVESLSAAEVQLLRSGERVHIEVDPITGDYLAVRPLGSP